MSCIQPPAKIPTKLVPFVYPNCYTNLERLGEWNGSTTPLTAKDDPSKYFSPVRRQSIGSNASVPTNLYVVAHGWAPGLRHAVNAAKGKLKWWSPSATDGGVWESNWAWVGTNATKMNLTVSPTGLIQQIITFENTKNNGANTVVLAYSWVDDSATVTTGITPKTWEEAAYSEAYTNMNGLRLAAALKEAVHPNFFKNPNSKIHLMGHSHGSKVATVATMELQNAQFKVDHLSVFDPPEGQVTYSTNSANLLGFYFDKMRIASKGKVPARGAAFVDSYISMFGSGYSGPTNSPINNVTQVGLQSASVFSDTAFSERHAFSATWYSHAQAASSVNKYPLLGLAWPPVAPVASSNYYQDWPYLRNQGDAHYMWNLYQGSPVLADPLWYGSGHYTNPPIQIKEISKTLRVTGSANSQLVFSGSFSGSIKEQTYVGSFKANTTDLYGLSFDMQWTNAQPNGYVVVTVQSPALANKSSDQIIAMVFDASAFENDNNWHAVSFNTHSLVRSTTQFEIHYFPDSKVPNNPGVLRIKNFSYVKES